MVSLILASASPRRAELLRAAGLEFDVIPAHADERVRAGEAPEHYVRRLAEAKARAVTPRGDGRLVLAADTVVVVDEEMFGKPTDGRDARRMLRTLSGRTHRVITGVTLAMPARQPPVVPPSWPGAPPQPGRVGKPATTIDRHTLDTRVAVTLVEFAPLADAEIDWYIASGEPMDKAGAYAIQGLASRFVTSITGSYANVVGLPVAVVCEMLRNA